MHCNYNNHEVDKLMPKRRMCPACYKEYQAKYRAVHRQDAIDYQKQYRERRHANRRYHRLRKHIRLPLKEAI